uniref:protein E6-like isoform X1 n=1 Tax=Fragaria vesca subsp. vesca TaxID=101020 RepID=UPI0005C9FCE2|nr:PREDICTED: protein E6-like isoform X1 [Fragaria vesca subsp. vesca]XP_011466781.1 PREDICTED: protein E6-like isoform X2 [Fragaria vesca subsp. vesca]
MASIMKSLSFFFLLMLFSSLQIKASDRLYFSKFSSSNNNYNAEDINLPLSYEQKPKLAPEVAALTTQTQNVPTPPPKQPSFSRNQYGEYGFFRSTKDSPATIDTSSNNENQKKNNNNGANFIYNMENDINGNRNDNIWDELKQQGLSDTRSLEKGQYTFGLDNGNKNRFNGFNPASRGSTRNEGSDGESGKQNEFDSLEEYEKYLQRSGYLP